MPGECGPSVGQCLSPPVPGTACGSGGEGVGECPVCCDPFASVFDFFETTTAGRLNGCFVGIWQRGGSYEAETRDGRWCDIGAPGSFGDPFACDDLIGFVGMKDLLSGTRWLRAFKENQGRRNARDARGFWHALRSNEYHPVPREVTFQRGTCWFNGGIECFDPDVCRCFRRGGYFSVRPTDGSLDYDLSLIDCGVAGLEPIEHIMPDWMFRNGWGWPPQTLAGSPNNEQSPGTYYCRRFSDSRKFDLLSRNHAEPAVVNVTATRGGGLAGVKEPYYEPIHLSDHSCNSNMMVPCTAEIAKPANPVFTAAWYTRGPGSEEPGFDIYYNATPQREEFNYLSVAALSDDPPRLEACVSATNLQRATVEFKNGILDLVLGGSFGGINFDRMDNLVFEQNSNAFVGQFSRGYFGEPIEVPGYYGECRLSQSGCPVDCRLFITAIRHHGTVCLFRYSAGELAGFRNDRIEPHLRYGMYVRLQTTARFIESPCRFQRWDGLMEEITLDGLDVVDQRDQIDFRDHRGRSVLPLNEVHWLGALSGHSVPSSPQSRTGVNTLLPACSEAARAVQGRTVPGWPQLVESRPDDPRGMYQGAVVFGFANS